MYGAVGVVGCPLGWVRLAKELPERSIIGISGLCGLGC
jgi:hypothetical protein